MRAGKDLIDKPIYSVTDGRHLGTVKDLYLDRNLERLEGLHLGSEGLFSRKSLVVPREGIMVLGVDAILTNAADVVAEKDDLAQTESWLRRDELRGREVDTPGGTKVGSIGDVLFDEESHVVGLSLGRVHVEGPIAENRMILRGAVVDTGDEDGRMTVDLAKAEQPSLDEVPEEKVATLAPKEQETAEAEAEDQEPSEQQKEEE
ncbi:MAG: PRC-barrel domain-containing protein [Candidatus Promineifilaceae bacterium]|nr:PRC-barrel domain-containing protein [Candidatus Promineifilaceae bacterium]